MIHFAAHNYILTLILIFISFFMVTPTVDSEEYDFSAFGLNFGTSKKNAKKAIESRGYSILREDKDDNDMKILYFRGALVDLPYGVRYPGQIDVKFYYNRRCSCYGFSENKC